MFEKDVTKFISLTKSRPIIRNYYAGIIRVNVSDYSSEIYQNTVSKCFDLVQKYDGDVNQFLCGIILALWGVPLSFPADKEKSFKFFEELKKSDLSLSAILINDTGPYGTFGNETRFTVTTVSDNIFNAIEEIISLDNDVYINKTDTQR
jgi:hypothetical protein